MVASTLSICVVSESLKFAKCLFPLIKRVCYQDLVSVDMRVASQSVSN